MDNIVEILVDLKQEIRDIHSYLHEINKYIRDTEETEGGSKAELYAALAKAQGTYKPLKLNREGPAGPYADLDSLLAATRESLSSNGLCFTQEISLQSEAGAVLLKTRIAHESGGSIESTARVVHGTTDRETGNRYEFLKKLHAVTLLGIAPSRHDPELFDDNGLSNDDAVTFKDLTEPAKKAINRKEVVDEAQYKMLLAELDKYPEIVSQILRFYTIDTLADLPKEEYYKALDRIRKIKYNAEEYNKGRMKK